MKSTSPEGKKKRPNKQHAAKGASFGRVGQAIRKAGEEFFPTGSDGRAILFIVATALEREGTTVRQLR